MEVLVHVVMLLYPRFQQLDLTGPFEVLARFEELEIHLVWKTLEPVSDVNGLRLMPTETFANCPTADILCPAGLAKSWLWKTPKLSPSCGSMGTVPGA